MQPNFTKFIILLTAIFLSTANALSISSPIACDYGKNCFIQSYMDMNKLEGALDYRCKSFSYEKHNGTDFRLLDYVQMQQGVKVLAVANGTVKAIRNTEEDFLFNDFGAQLLNAKECGNGVVITHDNGYESQYCHLSKASVSVQIGQNVNQGDVLGLVGMSGLTEFPHVHLTMRKDKIIIDPFTGLAASDNYSCTTNQDPTKKPLWDAATLEKLTYIEAAILNFHITDTIPNKTSVRRGRYREDKINLGVTKIILWADLMHVKQNDIVIFRVTTAATGNIIFETKNTIEKDYAQYFIYAGKALDQINLIKGDYNAQITLYRDGNKIAEQGRDFIAE